MCFHACIFRMCSASDPSPWPGTVPRLRHSASQRTVPHRSASAHVSAVNTLALLIKASAMVTVCRGHHQTLIFLPRIISLFILCIGIIRNNSLVAGCACDWSRTPATELVSLYCTWHPSTLTTGPHDRSGRKGIVREKLCIFYSQEQLEEKPWAAG